MKLTSRVTSVEHSVVITGEITGLQPGAHGLHVHAYGDLTNGCNSTKGHFNPMHKDHGGPEDRERHVGDLGNIKAEADGKARVYITDSMISLIGHHNIIGRAMVVHANPDDLGKGGTNDSKTSGSAGPRLACCVIGFVSGSAWNSPDLRLLFTAFTLLVGVFARHGSLLKSRQLPLDCESVPWWKSLPLRRASVADQEFTVQRVGVGATAGVVVVSNGAPLTLRLLTVHRKQLLLQKEPEE
ncbi:hypothetical protein HPB51_002585 [Rhipicephalus microplus]|uniref:superoxide dismutase n=1 Tax=Rhipicephalus microplus TaxID=6941 RepID=A0A9J6DEQ6_RHIMP|nr:hypothetical protein HPB51_002585 [Rhipicephalus microplus]